MDTMFANPAATHAATPTDRPGNAPAAPRFDMYAFIHKALRGFMMDTLHRVGRMDLDDGVELRETLAQVDDLLVFCQRHLQHENDFVHTAIEARLPGGAARTADDHVDHVASIQALRAEAAALPCQPAASRPALAQRLYLHLSLFVAENFQHMQVEETANNAALWSLYTDAELVQIHDRLVASLPPAENAVVARWMIPALNPAERAGLLGGMQLGAPPEAFEAVLGIARVQLDETAWRKLSRELGL